MGGGRKGKKNDSTKAIKYSYNKNSHESYLCIAKNIHLTVNGDSTNLSE